jgi:glutamyl-tRNA reductase
MSVVVIGIEHTTSPFDLLEQVTVSDAEVGKILASLSAHDNVREVALLSTCLRTEIYAVVDRFHDAVEDFTGVLVERAEGDRDAIDEHQMVFFDRGVATHLFRVAAGLESAVPGESEVLGQVRRSLERASEEGSMGPILHGLFTHAIHTGRKVRVDTGIARGTTSFSYASVQLAEAHLRGGLAGSRVVVLGAGALGAGTVLALLDERRDELPGELVIVNRTGARAEEIVRDLTTSVPVRIASIDDLAAELVEARLLISAVESDSPVVDTTHVSDRADRPLLVVDLGMPRNVSPEVSEIAGVDVLGISHLQSAVQQAVEERRSEIDAAEAVVADEVARYVEDLRGRGAAPIVVGLRERLEDIRTTELERRGSDLNGLTPEQLEAVEALTRSMMAKVAHEPTIALKESVGTPRGERLVEAARVFFGL